MDEHKDKDVAETSEERASDHPAAEDCDRTRIVDFTANDVQFGSVAVDTSKETVSDHVDNVDCEKSQIVESAASDIRFGSAVVEVPKETESCYVVSGECEKTQIVDSAVADVQVGTGVVETPKGIAGDHVASGDCEKTRIIESAASDIQVGSDAVERSKEAASGHVASGDCEKTQNVDSAATGIHLGSIVVETLKETASNHVASADSDKTQIVEAAASDIQFSSTVMETVEERASDHGASTDNESTRIVESSTRYIQVQVEDATSGSSAERVDVEEGVSCNGADVTVGVMPSDLHIDGLSSHDAGDAGRGKLSKDGNSSPGESKVVGLERDTVVLVVGSNEGDDSGPKTFTKSDTEALESRSEGDVEKSSGIAESKEKKLVDDQTTITEVSNVGVCDDQNMEVDGVAEVSAGEKIQVVAENITPAAGEEELEERSRNEYVERGGFNVTEDMNSSEIKLSENELHDVRVENGETQVSTIEKPELINAPDKAEEIDDRGGDLLQEAKTEKGDDRASNPEIDTKVVHSSILSDDPNVETQIVEEEPFAVEFHENQISEIDGGDVAKGGISSLEKDSNSAERDPIDNMISKSLDGHTHVTVGGTVALTDDEDITNIEGMDSDAFNENFCFSVEELQASVGTANGSTENHCDAFADLQSSQQPAQLVAGDVVATENKMLLNSEKDKTSIIEECQSQSMSCDSCQVHPNLELEVAEKASLQKEKGEVETAYMGIGNNKDLDSTSFHPVTRQHQELKLEESLDKKVEQESGAVEVSVSTDTDSLRIDGRQVSVLNSNAGIEVSEEEEDQHLKVEGLVGSQTVITENVADAEIVDSHEEQKIEAEEQGTDSEEPQTTEEKPAKQAALSEITVKANEATYQLPPDDEGEFEVSDLVWGKVRSHPWWPGQIFDPLDASEKAMKYQKKDCFLIAYFGDRTFAWNDASLLKPFRSHFSQVVKQSSSETFQNAVNCALEEVSRRVEIGLACSCIPEDIYNKIKHQMVENAGIRQELSIQNGMEKSLSADLFEPGKLVEYMKALAQSPASGADRLQIAIAKSQLLAFHRLKGYSELPELQFCGGLLDNADTPQMEDKHMADRSPVHKDDVKISSGQQTVQTQRSSYHKRKHNLKDNLYPNKKERSMTQLMVESWDSVDDDFGPDGKANNKLISPSSGKKRRGPDSFADESEGRKTLSLAKVSSPVSLPKPSFKIGECIRRVASQMTGSPSILKSTSQKIDGGSDGLVADGSDVLVQHSEDAEMKITTVPTEYSSLDELLLQLQLAARDPLKGYSFLTVIVSFFSDFRNAAILEQREKVSGKKRQQSSGGTPETFEFEDMNDTYWTDRVIQNGSEDQPPRKSRKRDNQLASGDMDKTLSKSYSRKRNSDANHSVLAEQPVSNVDENAPAELVMHFPVVDSVPSETRLIKMFKRFGPLKEIETEIDRDTNRARVVFKKSSDAEAAYSSATKFNIFGSMLVNYQLNYTVTVPFKTEPLVSLQGEEDATVFLQF